MNYKEIYEQAKEYDSKLLAGDSRFNRTVQLTHEDGSFFKWRAAFLMRKENWCLVFTEHFGFHIFNMDDVVDALQFEVTSYPGTDVLP